MVRAGRDGPLQLTVGPPEFVGPQIYTLTTDRDQHICPLFVSYSLIKATSTCKIATSHTPSSHSHSQDALPKDIHSMFGVKKTTILGCNLVKKCALHSQCSLTQYWHATDRHRLQTAVSYSILYYTCTNLKVLKMHFKKERIILNVDIKHSDSATGGTAMHWSWLQFATQYNTHLNVAFV